MLGTTRNSAISNRKKNADIETASTWNGFTALHEAAWEGHLEVVQYLVGKAGANLLAKDSQGDFPIVMAGVVIRNRTKYNTIDLISLKKREEHRNTFKYLKEKTEKLTGEKYELFPTQNKVKVEQTSPDPVKLSTQNIKPSVKKFSRTWLWVTGSIMIVGLLYWLKKKLEKKELTSEERNKILIALQEYYSLYQEGMIIEEEFLKHQEVLLSNLSERDQEIIMQLFYFSQ